jgi:hypothetical protein
MDMSNIPQQKVKPCENIYYANNNLKRTGITILRWDKIHF